MTFPMRVGALRGNPLAPALRRRATCPPLDHETSRTNPADFGPRMSLAQQSVPTPNCRHAHSSRDQIRHSRHHACGGAWRVYAPLGRPRWEAEQARHRNRKSVPPDIWLARNGIDIEGFAILQGVGSAHQCIRLRRIAVGNAGRRGWIAPAAIGPASLFPRSGGAPGRTAGIPGQWSGPIGPT